MGLRAPAGRFDAAKGESIDTGDGRRAVSSSPGSGPWTAGGSGVPRVAPATLGEGAGGGAPPSSSPSHFTEHDIYDQELGRPMRVKG